MGGGESPLKTLNSKPNLFCSAFIIGEKQKEAQQLAPTCSKLNVVTVDPIVHNNQLKINEGLLKDTINGPLQKTILESGVGGQNH